VLYVKCNGLDGQTIPEAINRETCVLESIYYLHYALTYDVDVRTDRGYALGDSGRHRQIDTATPSLTSNPRGLGSQIWGRTNDLKYMRVRRQGR
jgi:hypothetical protein